MYSLSLVDSRVTPQVDLFKHIQHLQNYVRQHGDTISEEHFTFMCDANIQINGVDHLKSFFLPDQTASVSELLDAVKTTNVCDLEFAQEGFSEWWQDIRKNHPFIRKNYAGDKSKKAILLALFTGASSLAFGVLAVTISPVFFIPIGMLNIVSNVSLLVGIISAVPGVLIWGLNYAAGPDKDLQKKIYTAPKDELIELLETLEEKIQDVRAITKSALLSRGDQVDPSIVGKELTDKDDVIYYIDREIRRRVNLSQRGELATHYKDSDKCFFDTETNQNVYPKYDSKGNRSLIPVTQVTNDLDDDFGLCVAIGYQLESMDLLYTSTFGTLDDDGNIDPHELDKRVNASSKPLYSHDYVNKDTREASVNQVFEYSARVSENFKNIFDVIDDRMKASSRKIALDMILRNVASYQNLYNFAIGRYLEPVMMELEVIRNKDDLANERDADKLNDRATKLVE